MLPADQRLRANRDFRRVYARGRSWKNEIAVLYSLRRTATDAPETTGRRIGFVVSKKLGDAVVRNRSKRRLREAVRRRLADLNEGPLDLVFVGRGRLRTATWPEVQAAVDELLRRGHLLRGEAARTKAAPPFSCGQTPPGTAASPARTNEGPPE
ncbi:MAG TPA: ribonuclease P protein component [Chthonomonadaceae bacterium]|nr:ribonuclease P protein component [Chthonomonadaceae bacterium]